jgi:hypothetical protein
VRKSKCPMIQVRFLHGLSRRPKADTWGTQNNCHRHDVACQYDRLPHAETREHPAGPISASSASHTTSYWQMRLFHHFTVATSNTLPGSHLVPVKDCWAVRVPLLALDEHKALWNSMLALAARHMVAQGCKDDDLIACRAASYAAALQRYRPLLSELSAENADAACLTSILLLVDIFASLQQRSLDAYEPPMEWLRVVQGTRAVFEASYRLVRTDATSNTMTIITSYSENYHEHPLRGEVMHDLAHLVSPDALSEHARDPTMADTYVNTVRRMSYILFAVKSGEPPEQLARRLMAFPCTAPAEFLDLVARQEPLALIILGHFFALSASAHPLWWVGETPTREVEAICRHLPLQYVALMDWPRTFLHEQQTTEGSP